MIKAGCPKAAVIMGSYSDYSIVEKAVAVFKKFGIGYEAMVCSAHRTPDKAASFAKEAGSKGFGVIIAAAGMAAHLPGVIAAYTTLPVIGIPVKSQSLEGMDSLLSMVQMPPGIPVAVVAVNGAENAAILAAQILAVSWPELNDKLAAHKQEMADKIETANISLQETLSAGNLQQQK